MLSETSKVNKSIVLLKMSYRPEIRILVCFMKHSQSNIVHYNIHEVGTPAGGNDDNKKLTRVVSTELSIEDYNVFRVLATLA